ncbi:MAG: DUF2793 domain-containing protein [Notoacmeibacter sp.]|nr:DUF2793 domain-containing protein [Notoacmeibacter sp.]
MAAFQDGEWQFIAPVEGLRLWNLAAGCMLVRHAGAWSDLTILLDVASVSELGDGAACRLGVNAAAETQPTVWRSNPMPLCFPMMTSCRTPATCALC